MHISCFALAAALALALSLAESLRAADSSATLFVAPRGNDANPGTKDKPFATVARARTAVRDLTKGGQTADITVFLAAGTYSLSEPLVFGPADSGTPKFRITYAAEPGAATQPVISGGRRLTGWKKGDGDVWTVDVPDAKAGRWNFRQLFVNGRRAIRARTPNNGFFRVVRPGPDGRTSFAFNKGELKAWRNIQDAEILFLHDWSVSRVRLKAVDEPANVVTFADPIGAASHDFFRITGFESNPRYAIENAPELLDSPGEWYLDRTTGLLSYWPLPGEDMAAAEVIAPRLETLVHIKAATSQPVQNVHLKDLAFAHAEWAMPEHGMTEIQAGNYPGGTASAALHLDGTTACSVEGCRVECVGGVGVRVSGRAVQNRIVGCEIRDVGFSGIAVGGTADKPEELTKDTVVSDNYIHHCAQVACGSIAVWVGLTDGTVVRHNEVADQPYTGVSVGWNWTEKPTQCQRNIVEFNHIHHVMQLLSDGGGIYMLGRQPGTVLRGNLIHDVPVNAGRAQSNGMFLDEGSSEFLIEKNTVYGIARSTVRFHKAGPLTLRANALFTTPGFPAFAFNNCDPKRMTFTDNAETALPHLRPQAPGKAGKALAADGASVCLDVPHAAALEPEQLTVEAWIRPAALPDGRDGRRWIVGKNTNEWQQGHYALCLIGGKVAGYLNIGGGRDNVIEAASADAPIQPKLWQHLAMTYDGKTLRLYLAGKELAAKEVNKPRQPGQGALRIGGRPDGLATSFFRGELDEVRVYKRALSADDLKAHAESPEKVAPDDAQVGYWGFEVAGGAGVPDWLAKAREQTGPREPWRLRLNLTSEAR